MNIEPLPDSLYNIIKKNISKYNIDPIILVYNITPKVEAYIEHKNEKIYIPLPLNPKPFMNWGQWFLFALEDLIRSIGFNENIEVLVKTNKGNYLEPYNYKEDSLDD